MSRHGSQITSIIDAFHSIIAVHGYLGRWDASWTDDTDYFWLRDVLPGILPSCRIISYECANLSDDLANRDADSMRQDLMNNRRTHERSQVPVIFLGAQLGGCFIKELFVSTSRQRNQRAEVHEFHACIRGFAFFSTPQGAQVLPDSAKRLPLIVKIYTLGLSSRVKVLERILKQIPSINHDFRNCRGERIQSICFYDTASVKPYGVVSFIPTWMPSILAEPDHESLLLVHQLQQCLPARPRRFPFIWD